MNATRLHTCYIVVCWLLGFEPATMALPLSHNDTAANNAVIHVIHMTTTEHILWLLSRIQTKFLAQVFLHEKTCARKLAQITRSHYASFLFKKVVMCFGKIQPPANHPISGGVSRQKLAWNRTCSIRASFWRQFFVPEKWCQKPRSHRGKFSGARNLLQKLASLNVALF